MTPALKDESPLPSQENSTRQVCMRTLKRKFFVCCVCLGVLMSIYIAEAALLAALAASGGW